MASIIVAEKYYYHKQSGRWRFRTYFDGGGYGELMLPRGMEPDTKESNLLIVNWLRGDIELGPRGKCRYKTFSEALEAYAEDYCKSRKDKSIRQKARALATVIGTHRPNLINTKTIRTYIEHEIEVGAAYDTVRLRLASGAGCVEWLRKQGQWSATNPFYKLLPDYGHRFDAATQTKRTITLEEYGRLWTALETDPVRFRAVRHFVEVSFCTGLRPAEVMALDVKALNALNGVWALMAGKVRGRPLKRWIAVPRRLIASVTNDGFEPRGAEKQWRTVRRLADLPDDMMLKTFRKDFANRMREAGAPPHIIDLHQGRSLGTVAHMHYLDAGSAVSVTRPYIEAMFGDGKSPLHLVKSLE